MGATRSPTPTPTLSPALSPTPTLTLPRWAARCSSSMAPTAVGQGQLQLLTLNPTLTLALTRTRTRTRTRTLRLPLPGSRFGGPSRLDLRRAVLHLGQDPRRHARGPRRRGHRVRGRVQASAHLRGSSARPPQPASGLDLTPPHPRAAHAHPVHGPTRSVRPDRRVLLLNGAHVCRVGS